MTFFAHEGAVTRGIDLAIGIGFEQVEEAFASDLWVDIEAGGFEEGGRVVYEADEVFDHATAFATLAPADSKRKVKVGFVHLAFDAGKGHAIVGGDDDDGVVEFTRSFELVEHEA